MKGRLLVQPEVARLVVDQIIHQLFLLAADERLEPLDDLLLAVDVHALEQLVLVECVEQLVVLCRALFLDVAEARVTDALIGEIRCDRPLPWRCPSGRRKWRPYASSGTTIAPVTEDRRTRRPHRPHAAHRWLRAAACAGVIASAGLAPQPAYREFFTGETTRVDYVHAGGPGAEARTLQAVRADGPWAGSETRLIDPTNLGPSLLEIVDAASNRTIFSRGFGSLYDEWTTTPGARGSGRVFHETVRFPWPKHPVRLVIDRRDLRNQWRRAWSADIDPRRTPARGYRARQTAWTLVDNGPRRSKVDLLFLGSGYAAADGGKFRLDVRRFTDALFAHEPFRSRRGDFNVSAILPSGRALDTGNGEVETEEDVLGISRYLLAPDAWALADRAAVPHDLVAVLVNGSRVRRRRHLQL